MPNWKKVIVSGSNAHLNHVTSSGNISGSSTSTGSFGAIQVGGGHFTSASLAAGGSGGSSLDSATVLLKPIVADPITKDDATNEVIINFVVFMTFSY